MSTSAYSIDDWLAADMRAPAPTFFARPAWALALQDALPGFVAAPLRTQIDGTSYVLPLVRSTGGRVRFRSYRGFPLGTYTCVLDGTMQPSNERATIAAVESIARSVDDVQLTLWPLGAMPHDHRFATREYETAIIDCSDGFEAVMRGIRGVTRRMAEQATRRGVICKRAGIGELEQYYRLLEAASRGWGLARPTI